MRKIGQDRAVDIQIRLYGVAPSALLGGLPRLLSHYRQSAGLDIQGQAQAVGQGSRVAIHEETGLAVQDELRVNSHAGDDWDRAAAHRFDGGESVTFIGRTGDEKIGAGEQTLQLDDFHAPGEFHGIADSGLISQSAELRDAAAFVRTGPDELDVGTSFAQFSDGVDQAIDSFILSDAANAHQEATRDLLFDIGIGLDGDAVTHQVQLVLWNDGGKHFVVVFADTNDSGNTL